MMVYCSLHVEFMGAKYDVHTLSYGTHIFDYIIVYTTKSTDNDIHILWKLLNVFGVDISIVVFASKISFRIFFASLVASIPA